MAKQNRWQEVAPGKILCFPDWLVPIDRPDDERVRGRGGYVVDTADPVELQLLDGSFTKLVPSKKRKASDIEHSGVVEWVAAARERLEKERRAAVRPEGPLDALNEPDDDQDEDLVDEPEEEGHWTDEQTPAPGSDLPPEPDPDEDADEDEEVI